MENKTNLPEVPYLVHEQDMARQERTIKRVWILCIILIIALIGSNAGWLYYESSFEDMTVTQDVEATADDGSDLNLNTIGGDYYGGESESTSDN